MNFFELDYFWLNTIICSCGGGGCFHTPFYSNYSHPRGYLWPHLLKQWAAVRIHVLLIRLPPQWWTLLTCRLTCHGQSPSSARMPPTILSSDNVNKSGRAPHSNVKKTLMFWEDCELTYIWEITVELLHHLRFLCLLHIFSQDMLNFPKAWSMYYFLRVHLWLL